MALLGLRMQLNAKQTLVVYGPPGTQMLIDGLLAGMDPVMKAAYGMPGIGWDAKVEVVELVGGSTIELYGVTVQRALAREKAAEAQLESEGLNFKPPPRS